jgi:uncharacterized membrane protein YjjP (DUF1212 family)
VSNVGFSFLYSVFSLGIFCYAVFKLNFSPWYFALMIFVDLIYHSYLKVLSKRET